VAAAPAGCGTLLLLLLLLLLCLRTAVYQLTFALGADVLHVLFM